MGTEVIGGAGGVRRWRPRHDAARALVSTVWSTTVPAHASACRILPDAHLDLVWDGAHLRVAGPDTRARVEVLAPGRRVLGLQVAPGAASAVLGAPASTVRDDRVDLAELWGAAEVEPLLDALHAADDDHDRAADHLEAALGARLASHRSHTLAVDGLAAEVRRRLDRGGRLASLSDLGVGERQLRRRCADAFGYGPKVLARVLRFQAALDVLTAHPDRALATVAAGAGYADQSHLTHEAVALTGLPPGRLRSELVSDPDKTTAG